jgi:uncharacterized membrane protein YkoI
MLLVLVVATLALSLPLQAAEPLDGLDRLEHPRNGLGFAPAAGISIDKATAIARKHTGGRVLSATPKQRSNGTVYRVRMLVDGQRVVTVTVDQTGRVTGGR